MILDKEIHIKVNPAQVKILSDKGYDVSSGDEITLPIDDLNDGSHLKVNVKCDVCGKEKKLQYRRYVKSIKNGGYYTCSLDCSKKKREETFIEKYGTKSHLATDEIKQKIKNTFNKKYGANHFTGSEEYQRRKKHIVKKRKETIYSDYIESEGLIDINDDLLKKQCDKCGEVYEIEKKLYHNRKQTGVETICTLCNPYSENVSIKENEVYDYIKEVYSGEIIKNYKLDRKEVDVYLPELKLGFEFNGLYWHSEEYKSNTYHIDKTEYFESQDIHLIHIYEDEWIYKKDIVKSRINNLLRLNTNKIYGRKCEIKSITSTEANIFLNENHIQGKINSPIHYGLYYDGELVSVMSFGKLRRSLGFKTNEGYELTRFANKLNTNVIGGASKLLKRFVQEYNPDKLISYADRSWSRGGLYEKLGFIKQHNTKPNYHYYKGQNRYSRFSFRKDKLVKEGYDKTKTEHQIMLERGYRRIYNSGSILYEMKKEKGR